MSIKNRNKCIVLIAIFSILCVFIAGCQAAKNSMPDNVGEIPDRVIGTYSDRVIEQDEFETFVDQFMAENLDKYKVAGLTFSMVKDGEVVLKKGYGYADVQTKIPVDANKHIFRVASISKAITATSVMMLYDKGQLELDKGINTYLNDYIVDQSKGELQINHLLEHSSGLEETVNSYTFNKEDYVGLDAYLLKIKPRQYQAPETTVQYSNLDFNLLGYIVQNISRVPFEQFVQENVFNTLKMNHSSFYQIVPDELKNDVVTNYSNNDGVLEEIPWVYINEVSAGGMYTTAADMTKFMLFQLEPEENSIAKIMQTDHFSNHKLQSGYGYGFYHAEKNGQTIYMHDGNGIGFNAKILLIPEQKSGYFMAINGESDDILKSFEEAFFDHYYPREDNAKPNAIAAFKENAKKYEGKYWLNSYNHNSVLKLITLGFSEYKLSYQNGLMVFEHPFGEDQYVEIEPGILQNVDNPQQFLIIHTNQNEKVDYISTNLGDFPLTFEKINGWFSMDLIVIFNLCITAYFLIATIVGIFKWIIGRFKKNLKTEKGAMCASLLLWITGVLITYTMINVIVIGGALNTTEPVAGKQIIALIAANAAALLTPIISYMCIQAWKNKYWSLTNRVFYTFTILLVYGYIAIYFFWNLAGFRLQ